MTNGEKMLITQQRRQGLGYTEIARKLGMSVNTVKSYCQRNGIKPVGKTVVPEKDNCRQCSSVLEHTPGRKKEAVLFGRLPHALVACSPGDEQNCQRCEMRCLWSGVRYGPYAEVLQ